MQIANRVADIPASSTFEIDTLASKLLSEGKPILKFGIGAPDFPTPEHISEAAIKAIREHKDFYTPAGGLPALREAIVTKFKRENKIDYKVEEVYANCGAKHSLYNICQILLNPGDEAIIPAPTWETHFQQVKLAEATPVFAKLPADLKLTAAIVEPLITEKTRFIMINSPSNPTGAVMDPAEIEKMVKLAIKHHIYLVSDECYEHLLYDGAVHLSPASLSEEAKAHTITVNAVSKTYAMTGWRIGYVGAPVEVIKAMNALQGHSTSNPSNPAQFAAIAALTGPQDCVQTMQKAFDERRKFVIQAWNGIPEITCEDTKGAFYAFPKVSAYYKGEIKNSYDFTMYLLHEANVAVVPGSAFLADDYIRFSYASSLEDIKEGMRRIKEALGKI
ncbi:MAG: pyridoxal phosphate-dependent aminotransferase [Candidatus Gracilibacteria bacterium]|nr:pyridoxal phosphate-dependent aminotransferase [Candidatus Gracilibacteria bacterium]